MEALSDQNTKNTPSVAACSLPGQTLVVEQTYKLLPAHERLEVVPFELCALCGQPVEPWHNGLHPECEALIDAQAWARHSIGGDDF